VRSLGFRNELAIKLNETFFVRILDFFSTKCQTSEKSIKDRSWCVLHCYIYQSNNI